MQTPQLIFSITTISKISDQVAVSSFTKHQLHHNILSRHVFSTSPCVHHTVVNMSFHGHVCGCYYLVRAEHQYAYRPRVYLPQVDVSSHTTILSTTSRTTIRQTFVNPSDSRGIREIRYTFPLFDGVSVVGFKCEVKDRVIVGEVKEREEARKEYIAAKERGETAGLLEQLPEASDVFTTTVGNVPPGASIIVEITYLGELKHDAEVDGARFTIPTVIAPRYSSYPGQLSSSPASLLNEGKFSATVDIMLQDGAFIKEVRSPSHPIAVQNGIISTASEADPSMNKASVTLGMGTSQLERDFVVQIVSKDFAKPSAVLETHPKYPNHKALMATLVPKFQLELHRPEIVFICDRSGSMGGGRIEALKKALQTFLKSLPVGVVFNICSFGSSHDFLWDKSQPYNEKTLDKAVKYVQKMDADYGGTEMLRPVMATLDRRHKDRDLEVFLVTDGEIWDQQTLFDNLNSRIGTMKEPARIFTLGIGDQVSSSLIEGVARAGKGFSQTVGENEKMDSKVIRMLKGALLPHINDYKLELTFADSAEPVNASTPVLVEVPTGEKAEKAKKPGLVKRTIALFDDSSNPDAPIAYSKEAIDKINLPVPRILQAPSEIPPLYPFMRRTVYLLLPEVKGELKAVTLSGTCDQGPLRLEIPVDILKTPGETIHQLAAKGAVQELEEGRGWIYTAVVASDKAKPQLLCNEFPSIVPELAKREAVRLGVKFQVGGKNCSFVAVEKKKQPEADSKKEDKDVVMEDQDYDFLDDDIDGLTLNDDPSDDVELSVSRRSAHAGSHVSKKKSKSSGTSFGRPMVMQSMPSASPVSKPRMAVAMPRMSAPMISSAFGAAPGAAYASGAPPPSLAPRKALASRAARMSPAPPAPSGRGDRARLASVSYSLSMDHTTDGMQKETEDEEDEEGGIAEKKVSSEDVLDRLVDMQSFVGSWAWSDALFKLIGVNSTAQALQDELTKGIQKDVLTTALVIAFLEAKMADEKDTWELIVDKARSWVKTQTTEADSLFATAKKIVV
jgi:Vault protein inter-alpha-trypsin domain/von Willebrand factor type A domain